MKKLIHYLLFTLLVLASCTQNDEVGDAVLQKELSKSNTDKKITICHKGKETININRNALQAHLDHGDKIGPCGFTYVPDDNFEQRLIDLGFDEAPLDDYVPTDNIEGLTRLDVRSKEISDLTGIQDFISLEILLVSDNNLETLNIANNSLLITLYCDNNILEALNVSSNNNLTGLFCFSNNILSLDLSTNENLKTLQCAENELISLNLSNVFLNSFNSKLNRSLECIQVDDENYYNDKFSDNKDKVTSFSSTCIIN